MNQKLSDWASIAEIVSGVAVVVTLVFLILGIDNNTSATRASVYAGFVDALSANDRELWGDAELSRQYMAVLSGEIDGLDEAAQFRQRHVQITILRQFEKAYFSRQYGVFGDSEWSRVESNLCPTYDIATTLGVVIRELGTISREFADFTHQLCTGSVE